MLGAAMLVVVVQTRSHPRCTTIQEARATCMHSTEKPGAYAIRARGVALGKELQKMTSAHCSNVLTCYVAGCHPPRAFFK